MSSTWEKPVQVTFKGVSLANKESNSRKRPFVINPRSRVYRCWETFNTLCVFVTCLTVPFQASFDSQRTALWIVAYISDAVFLTDVLLRFFVGFYSKGTLITDRSLIRQRYLRSTLIPDVLASLPLDVFVFTVGHHLRWHQALALLRLNRILRVHRLLAFFGARAHELRASTSLIQVLKYASTGVITIHVLACVWYFLACANKGALDQSCVTGSWAVELETGIEFANIGQRYVFSLYWATATATSTGYGDLHAVNMTEKWVSVFGMLTGIALFFGFILGGMASMMTNSDEQRARYIHHYNVVKDHMIDTNISPEISRRVMAYYEYLWTHYRGVSGLGMFNDLSRTFQAELSLSFNEKVLEKAPLFKGLDPGFKRMLSMVIRKVFYMPNQIIAQRGDIGHHMFYIHRGRADILCEDDIDVLVTLGEGQLFGEVSMVYNIPKAASIRAATTCVTFLLDRADLNKVLQHYPHVARQLHMAVENRCDLDQLETPAGSQVSAILSMEDQQAAKWLKHSVEINDPSLKKNKSLKWMINNYVIQPDSRFAMIWDRIVLASLLSICLLYTFIASFSISLHAIGYGENIVTFILFAFTYVLDLVLVADFFLRFNMATDYFAELKDIRRSYKWSLLFWLDLLAILPIEIFAISQSVYHERWHMLAFLRLNRLLKAVRIPLFFANLENHLKYNIGQIRAVKFILYIVLVTHVNACAWFFDACFGAQCTPGSWAQHIGRDHGKAGLKDYVASLYWAAATMSSTGYGDIHAFSTSSQLIAIMAMLNGLLLYGYCLSSIAATLANSAAPKVEFFAKMTAVRKFMAGLNLNPTLIEKTQRHLTMLWRVHRGEAIPGGKRLLEDMPLTLQQDVNSEESKVVLEKVPLFMETSDGFLRMLSLKTTSYLFSPGDYIVYAGDMGREMYCVRRGMVEVIADDDVTVVSTLGTGAYFGEIGLILGENRYVTVRAKTYCELLMIRKPDFDRVLTHFPVVARHVKRSDIISELYGGANNPAMRSFQTAVRRLSVKCAQDNTLPQTREQPEPSRRRKSSVYPNQSFTDTNDTKEDIKKPYQELSPVFRVLACLLMRRAILPNSKSFKVWQGICLVIAGIFPFTLTLQAAFLHTTISLLAINYFFDLVCLVDMYIKFHLAFYNENNVIVTHPLFTARNYLRTNFVLDLLASFPTDVIVLVLWPEELGVLRILALVRLNRALYLYKVNQFFQFMMDKIGKYSNLLGLLKFALYMTIFTHCIACGWFLVACKGLKDGSHSCGAYSWAEMQHRALGIKPVNLQYLISMYWASSTSASVGYGDIHAFTVGEMSFALFCMIIGIVFYGYIIASVAAGVANADAQRARYSERLSAMKNFLQEQDISRGLLTRIMSYYEYLWLRNKGIDASSLFEGLPPSLQTDITLNLYRDMIERVPLFEGIEVGFLKMLSMHVSPIYFLAKEYVVRKGDIGQEMYFIHRGIFEVVSEDDEPIVLDTMGKGSLFGELCVVFSCTRTESIRAQTNCDVFVLTKRELDEVLLDYPQIQKKILQTAEKRQRMVEERTECVVKKEEDKIKEEENKEKEDSAFVIFPGSKQTFIKIINMLLVFGTTLTITYMAAYQDSPWYLIAFNFFCEFVFYVEIFLNFHMAYTNDIGAVVPDRRKVREHYLKGKFALDIFASLPVDLFSLAAPTDQRLFVLSYIRLFHLLRLVRFLQFFSDMEQRLNIDVFKVRMCKFSFQLVLVIHVFACLWLVAACPNLLRQCSDEHHWVEHQGLLDSPPLSRYNTAVYWVVTTMTSTGYGDIHADNSFEMGVSSLVMVFGKLLFGFILGNIASTLANSEIGRVKYEEKLAAIQTHMTDQHIPGTLQSRVMNFYQFIWNLNKGIKHETLFYDMPLCMNAELHLTMVKDIICKVPLFEKAELPFIRLLCTKVKPAYFFANEYIVRKGDIGHEMFIVHKGLVEVVTDEDPPEVIETLEKGSFFSEVCLVYACPQKESVRAVTNVDMLVLSKDDVDTVLAHFDDVTAQVTEVASRLYPPPTKRK